MYQVVGVDEDGRVVVLKGLVGAGHGGLPIEAVGRLLLLVPLVVERLDLVQERLGAEVAHVRLLELESLVIQRLEVELFVLVAPHFVEILEENKHISC